ncbi:MAG: hypothetical protein ACAI43_10045 [Phycisphaerae bacterium]|nr:hypothetical protein [Tepidisphaeraceae bacterium]
MFKVFKYLFLFAFIFGGWALASLSLHVVRTPVPADKPSWLPVWVELVPKSHMTFSQTWVDATKWTANDLAVNADIAARLYPATRDGVVKTATARGIAVGGDIKINPSLLPSLPVSVDDEPAKPKQPSIFDFKK